MERYIYTIERNVHDSSLITGCNIASFDDLQDALNHFMQLYKNSPYYNTPDMEYHNTEDDPDNDIYVTCLRMFSVDLGVSHVNYHLIREMV
jgi:hypothetical protein